MSSPTPHLLSLPFIKALINDLPKKPVPPAKNNDFITEKPIHLPNVTADLAYHLKLIFST
jgi:hypothetical protein